MREIKFRALGSYFSMHGSPENKGKTVYFTLEELLIGVNLPPCITNVCQYTGLKDINGKEIYEGDIVTANWHWTQPHVIKLPSDYYDFVEFAVGDYLTVLGNVYENPELLNTIPEKVPD